MSRSATAATGRIDPPPAGAPWTVLHLLRWSTAYLDEKGVVGARLDVEHLLAHALGTDRLQIYLRFEQPVTSKELDHFRPLLLERSKGKPLQYVLGRSAFRDLELKVDSRVLIPRPETEELVGAVLDRVRASGARNLRALDLGTGSGAIALALATEGPFDRVLATDASEEALTVARENVERLGLAETVELRQGIGLDTILPDEHFDVLVSNPPYVPEADHAGLQPEVRDWEPREALVPGPTGLEMIHRIVEGAGVVLGQGALLALEVGVGQASRVLELLRSARGFHDPLALRDLTGIERIVLATWTGPSEGPLGRAATSSTVAKTDRS